MTKRRCSVNWLRFVPDAIRPDWTWVVPHSHIIFPIRCDAVCVIERKNEIAVVWFEKRGADRVDYQAAYWSDAKDMDLKKPPDLRSSGEVMEYGHPELPIWPVESCALFDIITVESRYGGGEKMMIWLNVPRPPLPLYSVEAFESDRLPTRFQGLRGQ